MMGFRQFPHAYSILYTYKLVIQLSLFMAHRSANYTTLKLVLSWKLGRGLSSFTIGRIS